MTIIIRLGREFWLFVFWMAVASECGLLLAILTWAVGW